MQTYCTRPGCSRPTNQFTDLDDNATLKTVQQKFCTACGMPQILIGRYIPTRLLGQGGFGAAYLAIDRYTPAMRKCVVKLFQPSGNLNPDQLRIAQELFEREGEVLEKLGNRHPQIPDLLAFFPLMVPNQVRGLPDEQFFYLVQQFIDGHNLEQEQEQRGAFSEAEVVEVLQEVLKVLQFVHDNGSIHRDIKPSNIMRDRHGTIFLLDFGAVKQIAAGAGSGQAAQSSTGIYSMGFAPPEQMAGNVVYPATDLYALGVTCITLLTNKQPNELYDPYSNNWNWRAYAQVSDRLEAILNRLLLPTPSQRFQSAKEVTEALQAATQPKPPPQPVPKTSASAHPQAASGNPAPASVTQPPPNVTSPSPAAPTPAGASAPAPAPAAPSTRRSLSTLDLLSYAAFTGFEGGLVAIALASFGLTAVLGTGAWLGAIALLVFLQARRMIEGWDLVIIAVITLVLVLFLAPVTGLFTSEIQSPRLLVLILATLMAVLAIAGTTLFRIVYKILSAFL
jgi:serine/threonine protein kinase